MAHTFRRPRSSSVSRRSTFRPLLESLETRLAPASLTVTGSGDTIAEDGLVTLREAIISTNNNAGVNADVVPVGTYGDDTITLPAGTYTLAMAGVNEDAAANGDLDITDNLTINGAGAATTIVQAGTDTTNGIDRVFHILDLTGGEGAPPNVAISGVTIRHGRNVSAGGGIEQNSPGTLMLNNVAVTGNTANSEGGGIENNSTGTVTITNSVISGNAAGVPLGNGEGAGIENDKSGTVIITNSTISNNVAGFEGGGVSNDSSGTVTITGSTISGNMVGREGGGIENDASGTVNITSSTITLNTAGRSGGGIENDGRGMVTINLSTISDNRAFAESSGGFADGGGINNDSSGTITITNSTFSGNMALDAAETGGEGGGIENESSGMVSITNSTFSGNRAGRSGGAISNDSSGTITVTNVTISANMATSGAGIKAESSAPVTLKNTIVANSTTGGNFTGTGFVSQGNNLSSDNTGAAFLTAAGDLNITNPLLGPLANNGGPTQTHALLPGSPAIDAGNNNGAPAGDQRGVLRPQDGDDNGTAIVDIGAVEAAFSTPAPTPSVQRSSLIVTLVRKNAAFRNEVGLFLVDDASGRIGKLRPGDAGYAAAALARRRILFRRHDPVGTPRTLTLPAGARFEFYLVQNGASADVLGRGLPLKPSPRVFFSMARANADRFQHVRRLSANRIAFEDQTHGGDRDFNDAVLRLRLRTTPA